MIATVSNAKNIILATANMFNTMVCIERAAILRMFCYDRMFFKQAEFCSSYYSEAVVRLPKNAEPTDVAPLLCAGVTVFQGMKQVDGVQAGDLVAIEGIGGVRFHIFHSSNIKD